MQAALFSQLKADKLDEHASSPAWSAFQHQALELLDWDKLAFNGQEQRGADANCTVAEQLRSAADLWLEPELAVEISPLLEHWAQRFEPALERPSRTLTLVVTAERKRAVVLNAVVSPEAGTGEGRSTKHTVSSMRRYKITPYFWTLGAKLETSVGAQLDRAIIDLNA